MANFKRRLLGLSNTLISKATLEQMVLKHVDGAQHVDG